MSNAKNDAKPGSTLIAGAVAVVIAAAIGLVAELYVFAEDRTGPTGGGSATTETSQPGSAAEVSDTGQEAASGDGQAAPAAPTSLVALDPIVVSLEGAGPRVRIGLAVELPASEAAAHDQVKLELSADILALLRTMKLAQIGAPGGLNYLRDDIGEIVSVRTGLRNPKVVVTGLVTE